MKHIILFLTSTVLLSSCNQHPSGEKTLDSSKVKTDTIELHSNIDQESNELSEDTYRDWKADTLITNHGFALIAYHLDTPVDLKNLVGKWSQLKMDSLKGSHILYSACDAGIPSLTFGFVNDTLHLSEFLGQSTEDYKIDVIDNTEDVKLKAGNTIYTINLDYAIKPVYGRRWKYKNSCVIRWVDAWGKSRTEIFAEESSLGQFDYVKEAPCDQ